MSPRRPTLAEPVEIAKFWKNRRRDAAIVVSLSSYEGHDLVNVREHFVGSDGCMRPTPKGTAMVVARLPALAKAVTKALHRGCERHKARQGSSLSGSADDRCGDGHRDRGRCQRVANL
jgi:Transcriptional Coactivator p15 (PC4)